MLHTADVNLEPRPPFGVRDDPAVRRIETSGVRHPDLVIITVDGSAVVPFIGYTVRLGPTFFATCEAHLEIDIFAVVEVIDAKRVHDAVNRDVCLLKVGVTGVGRLGHHLVATAPGVGVVQLRSSRVENVRQSPGAGVPDGLAEVPV